MKRSVIALIVILVSVTPLFSQLQALVKEVTGKVEIKVPGEDWALAREGTAVSAGTVISTGFGAQAVLDLGAATLLVKQLTRMRLDELVEREGTVSTGLFLRVGKVRADVKSTAGLKQDFTLRSPVSTAAVRGTSFDYDGLGVEVYENAVRLSNLLNQGRTVRAGESSATTGYRRPNRGDEGREKEAEVNPYTSSDRARLARFEPATTPVTIELTW